MKALVVDDDAKIVKVLTAYLERDGYQVLAAADGDAALRLTEREQPDVVLLDVMLPGRDGWEVCREIRRTSAVPIIMLTARDDEIDRIVGLELGADDYVSKPFSPREVMARIRAVLRRTHRQEAAPAVLRRDGVVLDLAARTAAVAGQPVDLTPTEFKLLELFLRHPGQVFTRLQLVEKIQGYAYEGYERTVDSHIKNLRKKIGDAAGEAQRIKTVYGVGYKWTGENHA